MKDEQAQQLGYFKGKYKQMCLTLQKGHEKDSLMIRIVNQETLECFEKMIDFRYLQEHQQISFIFQSPVQIMKYISENFDKITISKNGQIQLSILIVGGIKVRTIALKTDKKKMDRFDELNLKIELLQEKFEEKLTLKQERIKALEQSNSSLIRQIQKLNKESQGSRKLKNIGLNLANPHAKYFRTLQVGNSIIVNRSTDINGWYNFILNQEICVGEKAMYKVKVLHITSNNIYFGFGTKGIYGFSSGQNTQIMLYYCNGQIYEGGPYRDIDLKVQKGNIIECSVDLLANQASWKVGQEQINIAIPEKMRGKPLYFVAYSCYPTDQFEIMFDQ